jgi:CDP-diacylglycerol--glycerol-3-phosphate 3-phosphatidyltransferase
MFWTVPNLLTLSRLPIAAAFAVVVAFVAGDETLSVPAGVLLAGIAVCSEITDALDGFIARRTGRASRFGGILDPLCDSLSRQAIYFALALGGWVTIAVPLVMAGRDLVVAYTRIVQALTGGKTSARISGKIKAVVQSAGIFVLLFFATDHGLTGEGAAQTGRGIVAGLVIGVCLWSLVIYARAAARQLPELPE